MRFPLAASHPFVVFLTVTLALGAGADAAHAMPPQVFQALNALRSYEPSDVEVLENLKQLEEDPSAPSADRREAAFLRTAVSADLWLLAELDRLPSLRTEIARHWGGSPADTLQILLSRLQRIRFGIYAAPADDARRALLHVSEGAPFDAPPQGDRSGLLYLRAVVEAAQGPHPLQALASMAPDPCPPPARTECEEPARRFGTKGRRAFAALQAAGERLRSSLHAAEQGDPFAAALSSRLETWRDALTRVRLHPTPRLPEALLVPMDAEAEPWTNEDVVLLVHPEAVEVAAAPRILFDGRGPVLEDSEVPVFPETERVPLPRRYRPAIRPLPRLVALAARLARHGARSLAFSVDAEVPAHLLARVLRSFETGGFERIALLARSEERSARIVPVQLLHGTEISRTGTDAHALFVRVRLGGFTLRAGRRTRDVPRVRQGERLHFDVATLVAISQRAPYRRAIVGYMGTAPSAAVRDALLGLRTSQRSVALLLP